MRAAKPPRFAITRARRLLQQPAELALRNFTWVNNITTGAPYCRFAYAEERHCLAQHLHLPFAAISVAVDVPAVVLQLGQELLAPGQDAYTLAPPEISKLLTASMQILDIRPEWQMLFRGEIEDFEPGEARQLHGQDLPAMLSLAATDEVMVFNDETFARGVFFGVYEEEELVAMGGVQTTLPGYAEIGSIVTHPHHRRQGYATQVVSALVHYLHEQSRQVFLCLFQSNTPARRLYEKMGFQVINEFHLVHWRLPF